MESSKGPTKESKIAFKILIRSQNSSHFLKNSRKNSKLKDKTQELGISLLPRCRKNGQKTSLPYDQGFRNNLYFWSAPASIFLHLHMGLDA